MTRKEDNRPHFSVIVPVYNAQDTIEETVASITEQEDGDLELILVDDGSNDESLLKMLRLAGRDPRIKLVSQANSGVSAARNHGADLARGRLIAFCDSDDVWHPEKLTLHRQLHDRDPEIGVSYAKIVFLEACKSRNPRGRTHSTVPAGDLTMRHIIAENPVCTASNIVVSREAFDRIGGFESGMDYAEDQEWLARAVHKRERVSGIDDLLVGYRLSPGGLSVNLEAMYDGWRKLVALYASDEDTAYAEAIYCRYLARRALRSGNPPADARRFAQRGMQISREGFLSDLKRGSSTLAGAYTAALMPSPVRLRIFA